MTNPTLSILLPTYNRLQSLKKHILPSINSQQFDSFELIIVDDGSTDGTKEYITSTLFKSDFPLVATRTKIIINQQNLGLPNSRNKAIAEAKAAWIFMVEDDLELVGNDFLNTAINYIKNIGDDYEIIAPYLNQKNKGHYDNAFDGFCKQGKISKEIYMNTKYEKEEINIPSAHACTLINKEVFVECKYPNIKGLAFREEADLYTQAINKGFKLYYTGIKLSIEHMNAASGSGGTRVNKSNALINQVNYIKYHYEYLLRNYNYVTTRSIAFIIVWSIKQFGTYSKLDLTKRILALLCL